MTTTSILTLILLIGQDILRCEMAGAGWMPPLDDIPESEQDKLTIIFLKFDCVMIILLIGI